MAQNNNAGNRNFQTTNTASSNRGFAAMDSARQKSIASLGGQSQGKDTNPGNFANNPDRAREAGRRGGMSRNPNNLSRRNGDIDSTDNA